MPRPPKKAAIEPPKLVAPAPAAPVPVAMLPVMSAPPAAPKAGPVIDVENFIRVRDSVYQRLSTIQDLIKSFSQDYLRQTNLLLGEGTSIEGVDFDQFGFGGQLAQLGGLLAPVEEKKERKKRTHDPNAPKRPLTPYFLYMQTARPIIAKDLGEEAPKRAVQEEGQRRWAVMTGAEKNGWNQAYQYNLRLYNARVHSYKHGNPEAKSMNDAEALQYAEEFNIEMPSPKEVEEVGADEEVAIAQQLGEAVAVDDASEDEPAPITKTPKKPAARKPRKTATPAAAAAEAPIPSPPKPAATPASPEAKKRKRTSKVADLVEEPKKSGRKKTKSG